MKNNLKKKLQIALRRYYSTSVKCEEISNYVGINRNEFISYLNKNLLDGMTIENFGSVWSLDHIVPVDLFDLTNQNELKIAYNYLNIMPMFINDNRLKGASVHFSLLKLKNINKHNESPILNELIKKTENHINEVYNKYLL